MFNWKQKDDAVRLSGNPQANDHSTDGQNITDMEDFRCSGKNTPVRPQPIVRSYGIHSNQHQVEIESAKENDKETGHKQSTHPLQRAPEEIIDKSVDYQGWLESRKRKWRSTREKRKRQRYYFS